MPEGVPAPLESIVDDPELKVYIEDFGSCKDDLYLVAEQDGVVVGAVWTRIMDDFGHIDVQTPSLAISLLPESVAYSSFVSRNVCYAPRFLL